MSRRIRYSLLASALLAATLLTAASTRAADSPRDTSKSDALPHLVILMAEPEYKTAETLPAFAKNDLAKEFRVSLVFGSKTDEHSLPGIEALAKADVLLVSVRRRMLPASQLELIRKHVAAGKPVIGIRTANHAFSLRGQTKPPDGFDLWESFDADVFGGNYVGHYSNDTKATIRVAPEAKDHPILAGIDMKQLVGNGSLYRVNPLAKSATPLLLGSIPNKSEEPVAWTNTSSGGGRVFYTSLGHPQDFESPAFRRLLKNGIVWATSRDAAARR